MATQCVESSVKAANVNDYDAVPRVNVWAPGDVPKIVIEPVDSRHVGITDKKKLIELIYGPFALVIVPVIVIV